jgi:hypothetical protein
MRTERTARLTTLLFALGLVPACGSNSTGTDGNGGSSAGSDSGGSAVESGADGAGGGSSSSSGSSSGGSSNDASTTGSSGSGSSSGGSSSSGSGGSSNDASPDRSSGGSSGDSSVSEGGPAAGDGSSGGFTCNLLIGESPTGQWFDSGFLQVVDPSRWECIWIAHHYTDLWASPTDTGWTTPFDPYPPLPGPAHTCAQNSTSPDRVVFVAAQWSEPTAAQWETDLTAIVQNIQVKYPRVKRIELMALTGGPPNMPCPFTGSGTNETIIPQVGYDAIDAMPAKFPGLVFALPHFDVPQCSDFVVTGGSTMPQYTAAGAMDVAANVFGPYYAAHP